MPFASFHPLFIYHWWFLLSEQAVLSLPKGNGSSQSRRCFLLQMQRASLGSGGSFFYKWRYFLLRGTVLLLIIEDSLSSFSHVLDGYLFHCPNLIDASIPTFPHVIDGCFCSFSNTSNRRFRLWLFSQRFSVCVHQ